MCALQGKSVCPEAAKVCSRVSFWVFPSLSSYLKSMIHLELIFVYGVRKGLVFIFSHIYLEETLLSLWFCLGAFVKNPWASYLWVWPRSLSCSRSCSIPLPWPHGPDVRGFAGCPLSGGGGCESYSAHLFQDGFSFPGPWHFPVDLEPTSRFHKEACWGSDGTVPRGLWIPLRGPVS